MSTYAFSGAVAEIKDYGQRNKLRFGGVFAVGDSWMAELTSTLSGNFTLGKGNIAGKTITSVFKFRNRAILGFDGGFALSAIDDPTGWEEQNVGSAVIPFSTQYGNSDSAYGFSLIGNRFAVFGEKTTQIWTIDADPSKWVLSQVLDNTGTKHGEGVQAIGEVDVFYADKTGIRSLRSKELSGDAFVSDVGTPIDSIVRAKIKYAEDYGYKICSVIDPLTKNYWVFIYDTIFVLTQNPISKITAWATIEPAYADYAATHSGIASITGLTIGYRYHWEPGTGATGLTNGTETLLKAGTFLAQGTSVTIAGATDASDLYRSDRTFRPQKMFIISGDIYFLGVDNVLYWYNSGSFDYKPCYVETPWMDLGSPSKRKQFEAIEIAAKGSWKVRVSTNPQTGNFTTVLQKTVASPPSILAGSSYDLSRFAFSGNGTHIKLRIECDDSGNYGQQAQLSSINVIYNLGNTK